MKIKKYFSNSDLTSDKIKQFTNMLVDKHKLVPDSLYKYSRLLLVIVLYLLPVSVSSSSPPFVKDLRKHELLKTGSFNR